MLEKAQLLSIAVDDFLMNRQDSLNHLGGICSRIDGTSLVPPLFWLSMNDFNFLAKYDKQLEQPLKVAVVFSMANDIQQK